MKNRLLHSTITKFFNLLKNFSHLEYFASIILLLVFSTQFTTAKPTIKNLNAITNTQTVRISSGWNLLSLPVNVIGGTKESLFPTASSAAYTFNKGYVSSDTLANGVGFWLKFNSDTTLAIAGETLFDDTMTVTKGWNIVGSISVPIAVNTLLTEPPGIITSQFFAYVPGVGYRTVDTLQPGLGYWVKVSQGGSIVPSWKGIVLNDSLVQPESSPNLTNVSLDSNHVTLTFASGGDIPTITPGTILAGDSAGGYARKVISSIVNGNQLIIETETASYDEVINIANVDTTFDLVFPDTAKLNKLLGKPIRTHGSIGGKTYSISASTPLITLSPNAKLFTQNFPDFSIQVGSGSGLVTISADMMTFSLEATVESYVLKYNFGLKAFRFVTQITPSIKFYNMQIVANGTIDATDTYPLFPSPIPLGIIPTPIPGLVLTPEFNLAAGITSSFSITAGIKASNGVTIGGSLETGIDYENGAYNSIWNTNISGSVESAFEPTGSFEGEVEVFLKPTIDCRINSSIGVGLYVEPYAYDQLSYPPFIGALGAGVSGGLSASMRIFSISLFDKDFPLIEHKWIWQYAPINPVNPSPTDKAKIDSTSLTLSWDCSDLDDDPLTYDVYFGTDNPPATKVSTGQSDETLFRSGLRKDSTYYWKVVAKDDHNNSTTGKVWSFTIEKPCPDTVAYGSKTYNTVQIGSQCWFKENLDVGTMIAGNADQANDTTIEKYCYNDDPANCSTYGGLYQWDEAMQYYPADGSAGICPNGWHIPTYAEFQTLRTLLNDDGNALKAVGQGSGDGAGTNTTGFSALLSGSRSYIPPFFVNLGYITPFWSSTENGEGYAYGIYLRGDYNGISSLSHPIIMGYSVRCLKD